MTQPDYPHVSTERDPAQAAAFVQQALAAVQAPAAAPVAPVEPRIAPQPQTQVTLLAGLEHLGAEPVLDAEVRELTGRDEEALAKANTLAKFIDTLLLAGVVSVGSKAPSRDLFSNMLAADLELLLLAIRVATLGPKVEFEKVSCPDCGHSEECSIDLTTDVPSREYAGEREFEHTLASGRTVLLQLVDGDTQRALASATERTSAALNTLVLSKCVAEINGTPVLGQAAVRDLTIRERKEAIEVISERTPGPRLTEVSRSCPECSSKIPLPLALTDLFRF